MACGSLLSEEDLCRFRTKKCRRLVSGACEFGITRCQYSHNQYWSRRCPIYLSDRSFIRYIHVLCPHVTTKQADPTERPTHGGGCGRPRCIRRQAGGGASGQQIPHTKGNGRRRGGSGSGKGGGDACCCFNEWKEEIIVNTCPRGGECPFAHSTEEILYHPLFYKMIICEKYREDVCDTYYCPYIHGLAEARQPKQYKLPFTTGIDIPPLPCVTIVARIEKKKAPLSGVTLEDATTTAVGHNAAVSGDNAGSLLRQAVAAAQRQHRELQQRGLQICRSLTNNGESDLPDVSRKLGEPAAHSVSNLVGSNPQHEVRARPDCSGEAGASEDDNAFACKALFDALRTLEGDKPSCNLSMTGGNRRSKTRESGLEAVTARLTGSQHRSFSGSRWTSLRPALASQFDNTPIRGRERQAQELTPPRGAPRLMLGGIAPEAAASLASRMSPVQLLTAAFELCGHDTRKDTRGFSLDNFDGVQEGRTVQPDVKPMGRLTEVHCGEVDRDVTERQIDCDVEQAGVPVEESVADNDQMMSAQLLLHFGPQSSSRSERALDPTPVMPPTPAIPPEGRVVSESECPQGTAHAPPSEVASGSPAEEGGVAGGIPFASLESSTASSPLSSPSSPSQDFQSGDLVAFTTQSDTSRDQPCCMSATTRSPSESGAEPELPSPDRSSHHSVSSAGNGRTGDGEVTDVVGADVSVRGVTESGAVVSVIMEPVIDEELKNDGERSDTPKEEIRETVAVGKTRNREWKLLSRGCIPQPSASYAVGGAEANTEHDNQVIVDGERTELLEGEGCQSEVSPQQSGGNLNDGLPFQDATNRTPNELIDLLEQAIKALWENVWKHTPKQWTRIQCASRELTNLLELRSIGQLATVGVTEDQWSDLMSVMCALEGSSTLPATGGLFLASTGASPSSSSSELACNWVRSVPGPDHSSPLSFTYIDRCAQSGKPPNFCSGRRLPRASEDMSPTHAFLHW
ncbi:putative zinc finger protein [Toxoplasma gondii VAND]|uniref:Putative zinc finger protein n=1 Tax=Toxoplasma gondii VAND TaxID=933077 RepID=A0A086Q0H0_TOXGO|nr:putative zinc finger protein [Toxoplasma gondii VAND]